MKELHKQKIEFVNAVIHEYNRVNRMNEQCKKALELLPKEVKDLTHSDCEAVLNALPNACAVNASMKRPEFY